MTHWAVSADSTRSAKPYGTMNVPRRGLAAVHAMSGRAQSDE